MAGAFWCVVEDDRQGAPKKVMAEAIGDLCAKALTAGLDAWAATQPAP